MIYIAFDKTPQSVYHGNAEQKKRCKKAEPAEKAMGNKKNNRNYLKAVLRFSVFWVMLLTLFLFPSLRLNGQEGSAEAIISQADVLYIQRDYEQARRLYLEAARLTDRSLVLSRGFFGAALCSFYLGDEKATRAHLGRVFAVDPNKEISALFYPPAFLEIFNDVKKKYLSGELKPEMADEATETTRGISEKKKAVEGEKQTGRQEEAKSSLSEGQAKRKAGTDSVERETVAIAPRKRYFLGGYWEIEIHYGRWGLEPALSLFRKTLTKRIGSEVRREITDYLSSRYGGLVQAAYSQDLTLNVEGSNEGIGLRFYSQGERGAFSLGFSLERTHIRIETTGAIRQIFDNGSSAEVTAAAHVHANPVCGHLSFRWDFIPFGRVSPTFTLGLGFGPLNGKMGYSYSGIYSFYNYQESIRDSAEKTFEDWQKEQGSYISLKNLVVLQLSLGARVEVFRGLLLQVEAGLWDGFLVRAGLAFRL